MGNVISRIYDAITTRSTTSMRSIIQNSRGN